MIKREVEKYIEQNKIFKSFTLRRFGRGNNTDIFVIKSGQKNYALRIARDKMQSDSALDRHFINLKFLSQENIDFSPRAIYFDKKKRILISEFLPGKDIISSGLSRKQLEIFVKQLLRLRLLKVAAYKKIHKQLGFTFSNLQTPLESVNEFGLKRFIIIKKYYPDKDLVSWLEQKLNENIKYLSNTKWSNRNLFFVHGDLSGANILVKGQKISIIDWDMARFVYTRDYGLAYMILHFNYFADNRETLVKLYAKHAKINETGLIKAINQSMRGIKINDIIWSGNMYVELWKNKQPGWKKYLAQTKKRIKEFEQL